MSATKTERNEFIARIAREFPALSIEDVLATCRELVRLATFHGRIAEKECNEELSDGDVRRRDQTEARIGEICAKIGVHGVVFSGDPRGYTVKIRLPSGRSNSFGGEGWGVPQ